MFRTLIISLIIHFPYCMSEEIVGYDWSNHFGYANINGNVMWNSDWNAGPFFFDGTWSTNPGLMGPFIKDMFLKKKMDTLKIENNKVLSNFDYTQGDYLQDELSIYLKNYGTNKTLNIHGFKRSFAGIYNQYTPVGTYPKPIQQSYTIHFETNKKNDEVDISIGHFNTLSGIPVDKNNSKKALYDSRVTSSSIVWLKKYSLFDISLKSSHFLQRFFSDYNRSDTLSLQFSNTDKIRYLNRQKREIHLISKNKSKIKPNFYSELNSRSIRGILNPITWGKFLLGINYNTNFYFGLGSSFIQKQNDIIYELVYNYNQNKILIKLLSKKNISPLHPFFNEESQKLSTSHSGVEIFLDYSKFKLFNSINYNTSKGRIFFDVDQIYYDESNINLEAQIDFYVFSFYNLKLEYSKNQGGKYLNDGVKDKFSLINNYNARVFKGVLDLSLDITLTAWMNREPQWYLHLIESVPIFIKDRKNLNDFWFLDLSLTAEVASFKIEYNWKNLSGYLNRQGYDQISNNLYFHPMMPEVGSQKSLKIIWNFLD